MIFAELIGCHLNQEESDTASVLPKSRIGEVLYIWTQVPRQPILVLNYHQFFVENIWDTFLQLLDDIDQKVKIKKQILS